MLRCVQGIQLKGNSGIGPRFQVAPDQSDQKNQGEPKAAEPQAILTPEPGHGPETNEKQERIVFCKQQDQPINRFGIPRYPVLKRCFLDYSGYMFQLLGIGHVWIIL